MGLGYNADTVHIYNLQMYIYVQIQYTVKYKNMCIQKKQQCMYIKISLFKKKKGTGVFCTTNIHVIASSHMSYMYICYTYLSTFLRQRLHIFGWVFFALKIKISGKLKFQSKMCHIIQLNKSLFAIFRLYILYSMCTIYMCIQSIKPKVLPVY